MSEVDFRFIAYKAFTNGMLFHRASQRCSEQRQITGEKYEMLVQPAIVSLAFAVELYLKAIILKGSGKPGRGHDLKELFGTIPSPDRADILAKFVEIDLGEHDFQAELSDAALTFNSWRYAHEVISISSRIIFLSRFAHALLRHGEGVIDGDFGGLNVRLRQLPP